MIRRLQKRYALSEQGAKDLIKGCFACVLQNISFMFPVGLLYCMVSDLMNGGVPESRLPFYIVGCILCVGLILLTTYFQYNATYFATYTESGVRRITLAERLRKIPLSFFGKKDLAAAFSKLSQGKTVIMIAHRLSTVAGADRIYVVKDGQIAESGSSRELMERGGLFARMWQNYQTSIQWKVQKEVQ